MAFPRSASTAIQVLSSSFLERSTDGVTAVSRYGVAGSVTCTPRGSRSRAFSADRQLAMPRTTMVRTELRVIDAATEPIRRDITDSWSLK